MPKLTRESPPEHIVLPDTNILWHEDKAHAVSPEFDEFWSSRAPSIPLTLVIPEVVHGELHFQQTSSASKALERVTELVTTISSITQATHGHKIIATTLKSQVEAKLRRWLNAKAGTIAPTPVAKIHWEKIIQDAIWRYPPFSQDAKNPKNEKGFRDALILETVVDIASAVTGKKNIVFLSNDFLLRTTAAERLKTNRNFLAFESINDFGAYIDLTKENLTNKFVKEIQVRARSKFYGSNDSTSIYYRDKISTQITEQFSSTINKPIVPAGAISTSLFDLQTWTPQNQKWWIGATQFVKLEGDRHFHWRSTVTCARLFLENRTPVFGGAIPVSSTSPLLQRLLLAPFHVSWKAHVKSDGRFHEIEMTGITGDPPSFEIATDDELKRWHLSQEGSSSG